MLEVDDCHKEFAKLKGRGVKFKDAQPREEAYAVWAGLFDPDGNPFTIHETRRPTATADSAKATD